MAVTVYALGGMSGARASALGAIQIQPHQPRPIVPGPCVALYSDTLNQWSGLYVDDGQITQLVYQNDPLFALDASTVNQSSLTTRAQAALAANQTFLGILAPSNAQAVAQVQALTRQVNALIRFALNDFTSTTGT